MGRSGLFQPRFSHQSSLYLDGEVVPKSLTLHACRPLFVIRSKGYGRKNQNDQNFMFVGTTFFTLGEFHSQISYIEDKQLKE